MSCFSRSSRIVLWTVILALLPVLGGCQRGPMKIRQVQYLAVPSGDNTNYYRIRVSANTYLGKSEFRSGWFPADAVDALFGDVSEPGSTDALKVRQDIKKAIDAKLLAATNAYLEVAVDPDAPPEKLAKRLAALRAVRTVESDATPQPPTGIEMEYDPRQSLVMRHAGEKLVFVLSSDPDEVIGIIANFADNQRTGLSVQRLGEVIGQQTTNQVFEDEALIQARADGDAYLHDQIEVLLGLLDGEPSLAKADLIQHIDTVRAAIEARE